MKRIDGRGLLILLALFSTQAFGHPGHLHQETSASFGEGLWHPFTGLDHLLAMLTVGIYGAMSASKTRTAVLAPLVFATLLVAGALLGVAGVRLPLVEPMVAVSVLVFGLMIVARKTLPPSGGLPLIGGFAMFHGLAHGSEIPGVTGLTDAAPFLLGMVLATLMLHACGLGTGLLLRERARTGLRWAGGLFSLAGVGLLLHLV
jgi:urease accessory protein